MKHQHFLQHSQSSDQSRATIVAIPVLLLTGSARAQDVYAYPAKGRARRSRTAIATNAIRGRSIRPDSIRAGRKLLPLTRRPPRTSHCHRRGTLQEVRRAAPRLAR
jgi:hypothetical protein